MLQSMWLLLTWLQPEMSAKIKKRIRQCQRTFQDEDNVVLNGLLVLLLLLPHIQVTKRTMMLLMLLMLSRD